VEKGEYPMSDATIDALDVTLTLEGMDTVTLAQAVAAGRVFVLNGRGEYEHVWIASYWKEDNLLSTCVDGYEFDESGELTRVFQPTRVPPGVL
jgi:hypothetical protein